MTLTPQARFQTASLAEAALSGSGSPPPTPAFWQSRSMRPCAASTARTITSMASGLETSTP